MRTRIYLRAARISDGTHEKGDIPIERFFVNASDVPEVWVDIEGSDAPEPGRAATFILARDLGLGFARVTGTIERKVQK